MSTVVHESYRRAQEILGPDFHGLEAVEHFLGPLVPAHRKRCCKLRLRDHRTRQFLPEDETLRLIERHKNTHVLLATKPLSLVGLFQKSSDHFFFWREEPWFVDRTQRHWSDAVIRDPWLLVRKDVVPDSCILTIQAQREYLEHEYPNERFLSPAEFCYAALLHQLETGKQLCPDRVVRFPVRTAEGYWVVVGWFGGRLIVSGWYGGAYGAVGSASTPTS